MNEPTAKEKATRQGGALNTEMNTKTLNTTPSNVNSICEKFRSAMADRGLTVTENILADGELHKIKVADDHSINSWYILHADGRANGMFGCYKRGFTETWCSTEFSKLTAEERQSINERFARAKRQADEQRQRDLIAGAARAKEKLRGAVPCEGHPYLDRKGVAAVPGLMLDGSELLVPLVDRHGAVQSLQRILPDGTKRFFQGASPAAAGFRINGDPAGPIAVVEGLVTGISVHQATGFEVWCSMTCGNLKAIVSQIKELHPDRKILICGDDDTQTAGNPGRTTAEVVGGEFGAAVLFPLFTSGQGTDFNDLAATEGIEVVRSQLAVLPAPRAESIDEAIARLAKLRPIEFDIAKKHEAKKLGCTVGALATEVEKIRNATVPDTAAAKPDVWPDPVDGAGLLDLIAATFMRFLVLPEMAAETLAVWTLHTYLFKKFEFTPYLGITSAAMRCGKTTLLDLLSRIAKCPVMSSSMTGPVLFRLIEAKQPTLLVDEFDALSDDARDAVRGILNSGFRFDGVVHRCDGDDHEVKEFPTFGPKAIAGIGDLPPTVADRSIEIQLHRKGPKDKVERFRKYDGREIRAKCQRWTDDNADGVEDVPVELPGALTDRQQDIWEALFQIAAVIGGHWPETIRTASLKLSGSNAKPESQAALLLADIRDLFVKHDLDRLTSAEICLRLAEMLERPWPEYRHGKPITPNQLGRAIARFKVATRSLRLPDGQVIRGYMRTDLEEVFSTYLPPDPPFFRYTATKPENIGDSSLSDPLHVPGCSGSENTVSPNGTKGCSTVAEKTGGEAVEL